MEEGTTRKRKGQILLGVFDLLAKEPEGLPAREVISRLSVQLPPTRSEQGTYSNGARRFDKIVRFTTITPVKAGWMVKEDGIWSLTEEGRAVLAQRLSPEEIAKNASTLYRQWRRDRAAPPVDEEEEAIESALERSTAITLEEAQDTAKQQIQNHLSSLKPYEFEDLVAGLLEAMGYHIAWKAKGGRGGGFDVLAFTDPLGSKTPRIKVEVKKRLDERMDVDALRAFRDVLGEGEIGIYVSLGGFTSAAVEKSLTQEIKKVTLIDYPKLLALWAEHYQKIPEPARDLLPLKPVYFLASE